MVELRGWWIPSIDEPHPIEEQMGECAGQIARALKHARPAPRTIVQAGGRVGLWPIMLAPHASRVVTFEPDLENWRCAFRNLATRCPMVEIWNAALGDAVREARLVESKQSTGMHYLKPAEHVGTSTAVNVVPLDDLKIRDLDALFLDVEGAELQVLAGAVATIKHSRPLIVLEENELCFRYGRQRGDCAAFLEALGYRLVDEWTTLPAELQQDGFRGSDLIFAPR